MSDSTDDAEDKGLAKRAWQLNDSYRQQRCRHGWVDVAQCESCKLERELAAMRTTASKAMCDYETANHALANCKAVSEIQTERVQKLEAELARAVENMDGPSAKVLSELTQMTSRAEQNKSDYDQMRQMYDDVCAEHEDYRARIVVMNAERDALVAENQWHLASEPPATEGSYIIFANCTEYIGYWSRFGWYADLIEQHEITHWRKHFQPPKGAT
jgi:chromosome segregation ATPase